MASRRGSLDHGTVKWTTAQLLDNSTVDLSRLVQGFGMGSAILFTQWFVGACVLVLDVDHHVQE
jgi:hypothetical protein